MCIIICLNQFAADHLSNIFLTVYEWFMCKCQLGVTAVEAILQRYHTPSPASGPTSSSSSSLFDYCSSTTKDSASGQKINCSMYVHVMFICLFVFVGWISVFVYFSAAVCFILSNYVCLSDLDSFQDSNSVSSQDNRDSDFSPNINTQTNLGIPDFPVADSEEGLYYQSVLLAIERWFSLFGWPSGPHPISVPHTLRRYT